MVEAQLAALLTGSRDKGRQETEGGKKATEETVKKLVSAAKEELKAAEVQRGALARGEKGATQLQRLSQGRRGQESSLIKHHLLELQDLPDKPSPGGGSPLVSLVLGLT